MVNDAAQTADIRNEIYKLIDKAEKSREAHYMLAEQLNRKRKILYSLILIGSSIVAILTFANYRDFAVILTPITKNGFTLFVGVLASVVFILSVINEFMGWRESAMRHENAGHLLTTFIRDSHGIGASEDVNSILLDSVRERYNLINEQVPSIPNKIFLKAKRQHLIKVAISQQLDETPFCSLDEIKRKFTTEQNLHLRQGRTKAEGD